MVTDQHWPKSIDDSGLHPEVPVGETLVIRTWTEPGHPQGFRARITYGRTPETNQSHVVVADHADVLRVVAKWLAVQPGATGRYN